MSTGIFYGSTMGNTENAANIIKEKMGDAEVYNVNSCTADDFAKHDLIIVGSSTWGIGDLQDDWEGFIDNLDSVDLTGKKAAAFGLGDQMGYPDSFVDAIGILCEKLKSKGATIIGKWDTDGYDFSGSTAVEGNEFMGLALDDDNQPDKTEDRIDMWINQIKKEM